MRGIRSSRGLRASAVDPLRGASVGAVALLLALGGGFFAPAAAQVGSDDETTTTAGDDGEGASEDLPTCPAEVAGLELATTLDFADIARPLAPAGSSAAPTGDIVSYELYCPYGELPASAPSDAAAPLELLLSWSVVATFDGPGCRAGGEEPSDDGAAGVVGDPERRAQVDWSVSTDDATDDDAVIAAEDLLATAPSDTVSCEDDGAAGAEGGAGDPGSSSTTRTPLLFIGAAAVIAVLAGGVLLVRRRRRGKDQVAPGVVPGPAPVGPAVGPSPTAGPFIAGGAASQRAARSIPPDVLGSTAAAGASTSVRATAVAQAARNASPSVVGSQAAALALVAAAAGTLADADAARDQRQPDEQVAALAAALRTLARSAGRSARRACSVHADAPSAELDALLAATTRLVEAHRSLLSHLAPTETPR